MKIVAFMQNPWFPPGTQKRHVELYNTDQDFHRTLLANTMSGKRLKQAFKSMFDQIYWDNVAPAAAEEACGKTDVDIEWVEKVIAQQRPDLILTFGTLAKDALAEAIVPTACRVMSCHHPNARFRTQADLDTFAGEVYHYVCTHESVRRSV